MTREEFCAEFKRLVDKLRWDDFQVSKHLQISRPTVGRWKSGVAAAHPIIGLAIINGLRREAGEEPWVEKKS